EVASHPDREVADLHRLQGIKQIVGVEGRVAVRGFWRWLADGLRYGRWRLNPGCRFPKSILQCHWQTSRRAQKWPRAQPSTQRRHSPQRFENKCFLKNWPFIPSDPEPIGNKRFGQVPLVVPARPPLNRF